MGMLSRFLHRFAGGGDQGQQCCSYSIEWLCRFQCKPEPITHGRKAHCRAACGDTEASLVGFNEDGFHWLSLVVQLQALPGVSGLS